MMTKDIKDCKRLALTDKTNKIVAAVHEMGHYLVATNITSTILTMTAKYIEWRTDSNGNWHGKTITKHPPKPPYTKSSDTYILELCQKQIVIGLAGKYAELAMFCKNDPIGYTKDQITVHAAKSIIEEKDPTFDYSNHILIISDKLSKFMQKNLDKIAKNALKMYNTKQCPIKFTANDIV